MWKPGWLTSLLIMMNNNYSGFTLLELMTVLVVIAVLAAISVTAYRHYNARAASTELIELYDAKQIEQWYQLFKHGIWQM